MDFARQFEDPYEQSSQPQSLPTDAKQAAERREEGQGEATWGHTTCIRQHAVAVQARYIHFIHLHSTLDVNEGRNSNPDHLPQRRTPWREETR